MKSKARTVGVFVAAALLAFAGWVFAQSETGTSAPKLIREGTRIEQQPATCRFTGERLQLVLKEPERPILALENLAAERVLEAVRDDPSDDRWLVVGTITEFRGSNYIFLEWVQRLSAVGSPKETGLSQNFSPER